MSKREVWFDDFRVQESNSEEEKDMIKHDTNKFNTIMDNDLVLGKNSEIHASTMIGRTYEKYGTRPMRVTKRKILLDIIPYDN